MVRQKKAVEEEEDEDSELEIDQDDENFNGSFETRDVMGNVIGEIIPNKTEFGNKGSSLNALSVAQIHQVQRNSSGFYIDSFPLDMILVAGKIVGSHTSYDNKITFLLTDEDSNSKNMSTVLCVFWKINSNIIEFDKQVKLLSKKNIKVFGVLDFMDSRIIITVFKVNGINSAVDLPLHALQVKQHTIYRLKQKLLVQNEPVLPSAMSKTFNRIEHAPTDLPKANNNPLWGLGASDGRTKSVTSKPIVGDLESSNRFNLSADTFSTFMSNVTTDKHKQFYCLKVVEALQQATTNEGLNMNDINAWFRDNMYQPPSLPDLKCVLQSLLDECTIYESSTNRFKVNA